MADVAWAISCAEHNRETHVQWRDWFRAHPRDQRSRTLGDAEFHAQAVLEYDNILDVLRSVADGPRA